MPEKPVKLSRQLIVETALQIADRKGLGAISMRGLGRELGYAGMAVYEYVANKDDLLDHMAEHAISALPQVDITGDWYAQTIYFYTAMHNIVLAHPSVAHLIIERTVAGPNSIRAAEPLLDMWLRAGFSDPVTASALITLSSYTIGTSLYQIARTGPDRPTLDDRFRELSPEEHPVFHRLAKFIIAGPGDEQFRAGLEQILHSYGRPPLPNP